jgi:hypothetical protein
MNSATSASMACCNNSRAPFRNSSVKASRAGNATPGFRYSNTLLLVLFSVNLYSRRIPPRDKLDGFEQLIKNTPLASPAHAQVLSITHLKKERVSHVNTR